MDPDKAYKALTKAIQRGQPDLDRLDPKTKKLAMGPAEDSLEGYEPGTVKDDPKREEYKTFRVPKGLSDDKVESWKGSIDNSLIEQDSINKDLARFEAGRSQYHSSTASDAAGSLGSLLGMGAASATGAGGAQLAGALLGNIDEDLVGSATALANKNKATAMDEVGKATKAFSKAEDAARAASPWAKDWQTALKASDDLHKAMKPGELYRDINGQMRKASKVSNTVAGALYGPGSAMNADRRARFANSILSGVQSEIMAMPKISNLEIWKSTKSAGKNMIDAGERLVASKENLRNVASRAAALQDAGFTTGLKIFGKKAMATAAIASSPALAGAVSALGIPIIAMGELAKHGKVDSMLETMSYRLLERPVAYGDVGDRVHRYLVQNPTEAEELYSRGIIDADYYEWVAESVGTAPDVILDTLAQ